LARAGERARIVATHQKDEGPELDLRALESLRVLAFDGGVVAREHAGGPVLVDAADACSISDNSSAYVTVAVGWS
jgi:hypothetical protein